MDRMCVWLTPTHRAWNQSLQLSQVTMAAGQQGRMCTLVCVVLVVCVAYVVPVVVCVVFVAGCARGGIGRAAMLGMQPGTTCRRRALQAAAGCGCGPTHSAPWCRSGRGAGRGSTTREGPQ